MGGTEKLGPDRAWACASEVENKSEEVRATGLKADQIRLQTPNKKYAYEEEFEKGIKKKWVTIAGIYTKEDAHSKKNAVEKARNLEFVKPVWEETEFDKEADERNRDKNKKARRAEDAVDCVITEGAQRKIVAHEIRSKIEKNGVGKEDTESSAQCVAEKSRSRLTHAVAEYQS